MDNAIEEAFDQMSVTMTLEDDLDICRGDMIVKLSVEPKSTREFDATLCWFSMSKPRPGAKYTLLHTTNEAKAMIKQIHYKLDINTLNNHEEYESIKMNDIIKVSLKTTRTIFTDSYSRNRSTGAFILVDEYSNETIAAGMIL